MVEYISKDRMLKHLNDEMKQPPVDCDPRTIKVMERFIRYVKEFPAVDVQPVKRGKWKHVAGMNSKCSVCSHYFPVIEFDSRPFDINFCPNCGADMGETNEDT